MTNPIDLDDSVQAGNDLHMDNRFLTFSNSRRHCIDMREPTVNNYQGQASATTDRFCLDFGE